MRFSLNLKPVLRVRCVVMSTVLFISSLAGAASNNPIPQVVGPPVPQAVVPGSGAFTLSVYGANFVQGAVVNWNRSPRETTFISAHELQAQILASDVANPTAGYITVTNPAPGGGVSSSSYGLVEVHERTKTISVKQPGVYTVGGGPGPVLAADFTNAGILDLVTGTSDSEGLVVLNVGNGDGTFQPAVSIGKHDISSMSFGDFDGDGTIDLIYGWQDGKMGICGDQPPYPPCYLKVLLNDGHKGFHGLPPFGRNVSDYANGIVVGDFNRDGILDLAVFEDGNGGGVFLGNGDGTFTHAGNFHLGFGGGYAVTADFNGDGILDLVVEYGNSLYILIGNGDGTFQKPRRIATDKYKIGNNGLPLFVNDFNGDGIADLVFCDKSYDAVGRIGVLLGNGDGTFQRPVYYPVENSSQGGFSFTAGDFRSDGKTDLIAATPGVNNEQFEVFWGTGNGNFQKGQRITLPDNFGGEGGFVPGDFNSDGLLDFVMVNAAGLWVYVQK